jgi:hypothetical protein
VGKVDVGDTARLDRGRFRLIFSAWLPPAGWLYECKAGARRMAMIERSLRIEFDWRWE